MDIERICALGRSVIETEAQMIKSLTPRIDENFAKACQYLHDCKGRVVVMGVGKSGHIAKKIAATLASTGTPAFFIHPSEAKHGDIGMLTTDDVLLILSNSGETDEILAILSVVKRLKLVMIALTGKPHSTLAQSAHINLDVSVEKEACPLGLAPTSSTTAALVMGDALAMTLIDKRGFTETDFALSHPGGALGRRLLLQVDELMHKNQDVPLITAEANLKDALVEMTQKKLGMTTVVDQQGKLVGIFTDGDLRRALKTNVDLHNTPIADMMSRNPKTISKQVLAAEALNLLEEYKITALVAVDDYHKPIGIIHIHDILRAGVA